MEIPFGNSRFQIENFIANEPTTGRKIRAIGLQLNEKLSALKEYQFKNRKQEIELKQKQDEYDLCSIGYKKNLLAIELEEIKYHQKRSNKLVNDCIEEINIYNELLSKIPDADKYTREQFELEEQSYWQERLMNDAKIEVFSSGRIGTNTLRSLQQIGIVPQKKGKQLLFLKLKQIENNQNDKISS